MKDLQFFCVKAISKIKREKHKESIMNFFRRQGISIGKDSNIVSNIITPECHLIKIGSNVTIAANVIFITHDNSISKVIPNTTDLFGKIIIGDNSFIGAGSIILYGVELAPNTIVAAGSVVTKSFLQGNVIIGGNPAKVIGTWDDFYKKSEELAWNMDLVSRQELLKLHNEGIKLIKR